MSISPGPNATSALRGPPSATASMRFSRIPDPGDARGDGVGVRVCELPPKRDPRDQLSPGEQGAGFAVGLLNGVLLGVIGGIHAVIVAFIPWAFLVTAPAIGGVALLWLRATPARLDRFPPIALRPTYG